MSENAVLLVSLLDFYHFKDFTEFRRFYIGIFAYALDMLLQILFNKKVAQMGLEPIPTLRLSRF